MSANSTELRFRWRIIPAWFLMAFGGLLCLGWMFWIPIVLIIPEAAKGSGYPHDLASATLFCIAGAMWLVAGKLILNRRWWQMLACLVLGYAAGVSGAMLMDADKPDMKPTALRTSSQTGFTLHPPIHKAITDV